MSIYMKVVALLLVQSVPGFGKNIDHRLWKSEYQECNGTFTKGHGYHAEDFLTEYKWRLPAVNMVYDTAVKKGLQTAISKAPIPLPGKVMTQGDVKLLQTLGLWDVVVRSGYIEVMPSPLVPHCEAFFKEEAECAAFPDHCKWDNGKCADKEEVDKFNQVCRYKCIPSWIQKCDYKFEGLKNEKITKPMCNQQNLDTWAELAKTAPSQKGKCRLSESSTDRKGNVVPKIECEHDMMREVGAPTCKAWHTDWKTYKFNCKGCDGTLKSQCCTTCDNLKNTKMNEWNVNSNQVICDGCDGPRNNVNAIGNTWDETRTKLTISSEDKCTTGQLHTHPITSQTICKRVGCNEVSERDGVVDLQFLASCCEACLENVCTSVYTDTAPQYCEGCGDAAAAKAKLNIVSKMDSSSTTQGVQRYYQKATLLQKGKGQATLKFEADAGQSYVHVDLVVRRGQMIHFDDDTNETIQVAWSHRDPADPVVSLQTELRFKHPQGTLVHVLPTAVEPQDDQQIAGVPGIMSSLLQQIATSLPGMKSMSKKKQMLIFGIASGVIVMLLCVCVGVCCYCCLGRGSAKKRGLKSTVPPETEGEEEEYEEEEEEEGEEAAEGYSAVPRLA